MMLKRTIFVLAMFFLPATVNASDVDGKFAVSVPRGKVGSCGQYVAARDERRTGEHRAENLHINWIFGYMTAYNTQTPDTYDIQGQTDLSEILVWLEDYCKQNPLHGFIDAMTLLMDELHPKRIRKAPK
jgi:hypothetical protein